MIPVRVLDENRQLINEQRGLTGKSKISYTHLIGWALIRAIDEFRQLNDAYTEQKGESFRVVRKSVNFGLAVDVKGKDGNSTLMVPEHQRGERVELHWVSESVRRCRRASPDGQTAAKRLRGNHHQSHESRNSRNLWLRPQAVVGQGAIIATGATDYPAGYSQVSPEMRASLGITKATTMTCTYDHRIIQGAESGRFLARVYGL